MGELKFLVIATSIFGVSMLFIWLYFLIKNL